MEIRVLEYFLVTAREENITKAASLLHITQPTLSRQLIALEEELGVKLFKRSSHSVVLTDEGLLLKRRASEIVELSRKTKLEFSSGAAELSGEIAIGSGEFLTVDKLCEMMAQFKELHPLVKFKIFSSNSDSIKERIDSGILDIGLVMDYIDITKYEYLRFSKKEIHGILVKEDGPLAKKEYLTPEDMRDVPLIISQGSLRNNELSDWFGHSLEKLNIVASCNLMYNAAQMVRNGLGVADCIKLRTKFDGLKFIPTKPNIGRNTVLIWKKTVSHSAAVTEFIEFAKEHID